MFRIILSFKPINQNVRVIWMQSYETLGNLLKCVENYSFSYLYRDQDLTVLNHLPLLATHFKANYWGYAQALILTN